MKLSMHAGKLLLVKARRYSVSHILCVFVCRPSCSCVTGTGLWKDLFGDVEARIHLWRQEDSGQLAWAAAAHWLPGEIDVLGGNDVWLPVWACDVVNVLVSWFMVQFTLWISGERPTTRKKTGVGVKANTMYVWWSTSLISHQKEYWDFSWLHSSNCFSDNISIFHLSIWSRTRPHFFLWNPYYPYTNFSDRGETNLTLFLEKRKVKGKWNEPVHGQRQSTINLLALVVLVEIRVSRCYACEQIDFIVFIHRKYACISCLYTYIILEA